MLTAAPMILIIMLVVAIVVVAAAIIMAAAKFNSQVTPFNHIRLLLKFDFFYFSYSLIEFL